VEHNFLFCMVGSELVFGIAKRQLEWDGSATYAVKFNLAYIISVSPVHVVKLDYRFYITEAPRCRCAKGIYQTSDSLLERLTGSRGTVSFARAGDETMEYVMALPQASHRESARVPLQFIATFLTNLESRTIIHLSSVTLAIL
jgi:hypothetical protein